MQLTLKRLFLRTLGRLVPSDLFSYRHPVSVKGVCLVEGRVVLVKNERRQWDLPGGKLKRNEEIEACLQREIKEELNISARPERLLDATTVNVMNTINVLVLIYTCSTQASLAELKGSTENFGVKTFSRQELTAIELPENYRVAIQEAFERRVRKYEL